MFFLIFYLITSILLGIYFSKGIKTLKDFSTIQNYTTPVLLATLFATVIGGGSTLGIVTNVHKYGIIFMFAFMGAGFNKYLVALYVSQKIQLLTNVDSMGELFEKNYGKYGRILCGFFIIIVCIACIGNHITALGFVLEIFLNIPFSTGILISFGTLILYSSIGGIRAVVATDVYQFILITVFVAITIIACFNSFGGMQHFINHIPTEKISIFSQSQYIMKASTIFVMMLFSGLDPAFIHRLFMAKKENQATKITLLTGHFSFALFACMGIVGLFASSLFPNIESSIALPHIITNLLPTVLKELAIIGLLATIMSSADSLLHVAGVSFVEDIILTLKKSIKETDLINYARFSIIAMGIISVIISYSVKDLFSIIILAFSFWGPVILLPFVCLLYNIKFNNKELYLGIFISTLTIILWFFILQERTGLHGYIPGTFINIIYFFCCKFIKEMKSG